MGNQQGVPPRERHKSGSQDLLPGSPLRGKYEFFSFSQQFHLLETNCVIKKRKRKKNYFQLISINIG